MSNPNLDSLDMNSEIDFDLEELMLIEPILPVSTSTQHNSPKDNLNDNAHSSDTLLSNQQEIINSAGVNNVADDAMDVTNISHDIPPEILVFTHLQNQPTLDNQADDLQTVEPVQEIEPTQAVEPVQEIGQANQSVFTTAHVQNSLLNSMKPIFEEKQAEPQQPSPVSQSFAEHTPKSEPVVPQLPPVSLHHTPTPLTTTRKILNAFFIGIFFGVIGLLIDWALHIVRALASDTASNIAWLFFPMLSVIGVLFGFFFGAKALNVVFGTSATVHLDNESDDGFTSGLLKAVGIAIGIAIITWFVMLIML